MWTADDMRRYREDGFLFIPGLLSAGETDALNVELPAILGGEDERDGLHRERERSGAVRQVYLAHRVYEPFRRLSRDPRLTGPVKQALGADVYVWHSKVNVKDAFEGTVWLWHQDFGYWNNDGVASRFVSVMVFLDEATLNNGCFMLAAGSHRWGLLPHFADTVTTSYKQWCVETTVLKQRLREDMIRPIVGKPGDALFFDPNLLHASGHNMSPLPRKSVIVCYNDIANKPREIDDPRPDWVVSRDFTVVS